MHVIWSRKIIACYLEQEDKCMLTGVGEQMHVTWSRNPDACYSEQEDIQMLP